MRLKKILFISTLLFIAFATTAGIYAYSQINKINNVEISKSDEDLGINIKPYEYLEVNPKTDLTNIIETEPDKIAPIDDSKGLKKAEKTIENYNSKTRSIALFGVDVGRNKYDIPHSDTIIIATIDPQHKKIKLSSIMRDTYVAVRGYGKRKISDAYALGGPQLALRTLNENFGLNIRDYATVDFFTLEKAINVFNGISVEVKESELKELNYRIKESAELQGKAPALLTNAGMQNLNGIQAVAYCRIRKVGSGDFERTSRQRAVLSKLVAKAQAGGIGKYHYLASEIFPLIETSLSSTEILKLGRQVITTGVTNVEQQRFPLDGYCKGEMIKGVWYLTPKPNLQTTREQITRYIFQDIKPVPKAPLF